MEIDELTAVEKIGIIITNVMIISKYTVSVAANPEARIK